MRNAILAAVILAATQTVQAQAPVTLWLGGARGTSDSSTIALKNSDVMVGVQLSMPLFPIALRAEAMASGSDITGSPRSYFVNAVLPFNLPGINPYLVGGYGKYSYGTANEVGGYNYGGGVRLGFGRFGIFGEVRQHEKIDRRLAMVGITL
jgi:hypothetical protein